MNITGGSVPPPESGSGAATAAQACGSPDAERSRRGGRRSRRLPGRPAEPPVRRVGRRRRRPEALARRPKQPDRADRSGRPTSRWRRLRPRHPGRRPSPPPWSGRRAARRTSSAAPTMTPTPDRRPLGAHAGSDAAARQPRRRSAAGHRLPVRPAVDESVPGGWTTAGRSARTPRSRSRGPEVSRTIRSTPASAPTAGRQLSDQVGHGGGQRRRQPGHQQGRPGAHGRSDDHRCRLTFALEDQLRSTAAPAATLKSAPPISRAGGLVERLVAAGTLGVRIGKIPVR